MSFEVRATYELDLDDSNPFEKDELAEAAAGRKAEWSGAGACRDLCGGREMGWTVPTFEEAQAMKQRLDAVSGLIVRMQEDITYA